MQGPSKLTTTPAWHLTTRKLEYHPADGIARATASHHTAECNHYRCLIPRGHRLTTIADMGPISVEVKQLPHWSAAAFHHPNLTAVPLSRKVATFSTRVAGPWRDRCVVSFYNGGVDEKPPHHGSQWNLEHHAALIWEKVWRRATVIVRVDQHCDQCIQITRSQKSTTSKGSIRPRPRRATSRSGTTHHITLVFVHPVLNGHHAWVNTSHSYQTFAMMTCGRDPQ